jgi:hypothetical protein
MHLDMFVPITKVHEGESNTPCPSTLEVTYSSVEKLSKAVHVHYNTVSTFSICGFVNQGES